MNHIVDTSPLAKSEGGMDLLREADDDAVIWLESTATAALAKQIIILQADRTVRESATLAPSLRHDADVTTPE